MKHFLKEFDIVFIECYKPKDETETKELVVAVGYIVIIKDDQEKRKNEQELTPGKDGSVRSARIVVCSDKGKIGNKVFCRPLKVVIPLEVPADFNQLHLVPQQATPLAQLQTPNQIDRMTRSKCNAGVIGEFIHRQGRS